MLVAQNMFNLIKYHEILYVLSNLSSMFGQLTFHLKSVLNIFLKSLGNFLLMIYVTLTPGSLKAQYAIIGRLQEG